MGAPPGPDQVLELLQNPQYASQLNQVLSNPDLVNSMIEGNPMLRGMGDSARQALTNPMFRRMMTDPDTLRQMAQMQRQFPAMFGGMGGGRGGGQEQAFPAPGITDQTPEQPSGESTATPNQPNTVPQQPPMNPFPLGMFGDGAGAGGAAGNPFAALFPTPQQQAGSNAPTTGQAQGNPQNASSTAQQPQANPFQEMAAQMASNPAFMQNMMGMLGGGGSNAGGQGQQQDPNAINPFGALFGPGGMGGGGNPFGGAASPPAAPPDTRPPEDRYAEQLRQLNDMGFYEFERNVEALRRAGGSVQGAVEYLLTH